MHGIPSRIAAWSALYGRGHATTKASPTPYRAGDAETSEADITYAMSASHIKRGCVKRYITQTHPLFANLN